MQLGIRGYPTIMLFHKGSVHAYRDRRVPSSFVEFLKGKGLLVPRQQPGSAAAEEAPEEQEPEFELHYLGCRGQAETIQMMLEDAGLGYRRVDYSETDWHALLEQDERFFPSGDEPLLIARVGGVGEPLLLRHQLTSLEYIFQRRTGSRVTATRDGKQFREAIRAAHAAYLEVVYTTSRDEFSKRLDQYMHGIPRTLAYLEKACTRLTPNLLAAGDVTRTGFTQLRPEDWLLFDFLDLIDELCPTCLQGGIYPALSGRLAGIKDRPAISNYRNSDRRHRYAHHAASRQPQHNCEAFPLV